MIPVITVDGPSGSGKGTLCRLLAKELGYHLLDSGALYRLTALAATKAQCDVEDEALLGQVAGNLNIEFKVSGQKVSILLDGQDVSTQIREESIGLLASKVAAYTAVRQALLERQRVFRVAPGLVADGRDMGTVVFPSAQVKVFLHASAQERAKRRVAQLEESGMVADYEKILADIQRRDEQDRTRVNAPLIPASDALELDSTELSIEEVFNIVNQKIIATLGKAVETEL